jgi:hypothetical protein
MTQSALEPVSPLHEELFSRSDLSIADRGWRIHALCSEHLRVRDRATETGQPQTRAAAAFGIGTSGAQDLDRR